MRLRLFAALVITTSLLTTASGAQVDQVHVVPDSPGQILVLPANNEFYSAQTFTVGMAGWLTAIDLGVYRDAPFDEPLIVDIARLIGTSPDFSPAGLIARRTVPAASVRYVDVYLNDDVYYPEFTLRVDFSADNVAVVPGDQLAIILRSDVQHMPAFQSYRWWSIDGDGSQYPGGSLFQAGNYATHHWGGDAHFRTLVTIPEPAAALLILIGLAVVRPRTRRFV